MPKFDGPLSKHQKYFLQSLGCGWKPSSSHLKSPPGSGVVGGGGVVVRALEYFAASFTTGVGVGFLLGLGRRGVVFSSS